MAAQKSHPQTLLEAVRYFSDLDVATEFVAKLRWPDGFVCPACGHTEYSYLKTRRLWKCKACKKQTSVKKGTIFEDSPLGLDKWLTGMWLVLNCKNGISSHELARDLGIHQQSAWFMLHRIRLAMHTGSFAKLSGEVESDESFIGGRATNMHRRRRREKFGDSKNPFENKTIVMGILERSGQIQAHVVPSLRPSIIQSKIREAVLPGTSLYTDKMSGYRGLGAFSEYEHRVVDHAERYVDGRVHVNGVENFWSLLGRSLKGTYISVQPDHLHRYLDEQVFRYNHREGGDADRLSLALGRVEGRRITYKELTAKATST